MAILKSLGMNSKNACMLFLGLIVIVFLLSLFKNTKEYMTTDDFADVAALGPKQVLLNSGKKS